MRVFPYVSCSSLYFEVSWNDMIKFSKSLWPPLRGMWARCPMLFESQNCLAPAPVRSSHVKRGEYRQGAPNGLGAVKIITWYEVVGWT